MPAGIIEPLRRGKSIISGNGRRAGTILVAIVALFVLDLFGAADSNRAVYDFCVQHLGQQVGDGVCHTLVDQALRSAGLPPDYHYEREVWRITSTPHGVVIRGDFNKVLPGDIIYFHDISNDRCRYKGSGGRPPDRGHPKENHIGVVDRITIDGVRYFNQNSGRQKLVKSDYFSFVNDIDVVEYVAIIRP